MLATTGSLSPRRLARASSVRARQHLDDEHFVVRAIRLAAHAVAADDAQAAARRSRAQLPGRRVAHQQMPAEGSDDFGVELCRRLGWWQSFV